MYEAINTTQIPTYEFSQDLNTFGYETICNPHLDLQCKHDKTKSQFDPGSLVTFAGVCQDICDNKNCVYPNQVGMILNKGKREFYEDNYVQVLLLAVLLDTWNSYRLTDLNNLDLNNLIERLKLHNKAELIININKYNLQPIFQTELKLLGTS